LALVYAWGDRVETTDEVLLSKVFEAAGLELSVRAAPLSDNEVDSHVIRRFRKVGIYSLLESAAQAAAGWIKQMWPGTEVTLSHDHVNSQALEALVRSSDVMLVQTSRATHAATGAIAAAAVDKTIVVLVAGRGATSLLRGILEWSEAVP
jgi:hypothetical protein